MAKPVEKAPTVIETAEVKSPETETSVPSMISMYLSMSNTANKSAEPSPKEYASQPEIKSRESTRPILPQKIYLRVPNMSGDVFKKAKNMVDIFNEGTITVIFYDSSTAKYSEYSEKMFYSEYAIRELKKIIGDDNVVTK